MDHRGRFQAQGGGIDESEPWKEPEPLAALKAHHLLSWLEYSIHAREARMRHDAFRKAHRFIDGCVTSGGIGPTKQSWPKPDRPDSRRVDIEVHAGIAFV